MEALVSLLVFALVFALLAFGFLACKKAGGCHGPEDEDQKGCGLCDPDTKQDKE